MNHRAFLYIYNLYSITEKSQKDIPGQSLAAVAGMKSSVSAGGAAWVWKGGSVVLGRSDLWTGRRILRLQRVEKTKK